MHSYKYFLGFENDRNAHNSALYVRFLRLAFEDSHEIVVTGHHFMCTPNTGNEEEDMRNINEIPSADTLIFDHDVMRTVFGGDFLDVIKALAVSPASGREAILQARLDWLEQDKRYTIREESDAENEGMPASGYDVHATAQDVELNGGID